MQAKRGDFRFLSEEEFERLDCPSQYAFLREAFQLLQDSRPVLQRGRTSANDDSSQPPPRGGRAHRF